jgi:hypothetical protein
VALAALALTTVSALEQELGIASGSAGTTLALLERAIHAASQAIASAVGRELHYATGRIERVAGHRTPQLLVRVTPLRSIASIVYLSSSGGEETIEADDYEIEDASAGIIRRVGGVWLWTGRVTRIDADPLGGSELLLYRVTYTGGWVTPEQATGLLPRDLPYDIEDACLRLAALVYRARGRDESIRSKKLLDASVTYGATAEAQATILAPIVATYRGGIL